MTRNRASRPRTLILSLAGIALVASLSGCISLGGGSPPSKTYIVVPRGTTAAPAPNQ